MNITGPNLKPYRDYDEHEVLNGFFSANVATLNKGTFVSIVSGASGNMNVFQGGNSPVTPLVGQAYSYGSGPARVTSFRSETKWKVAPSASGTIPLGITLYDVKENNAFGEPYITRPSHERAEAECVVSGEAVPILTRGLVLMKNFIGTPVEGSGIINAITGSGVVGPYVKGTSFARILSRGDAEGYAFVKIEL